MFLYGGLVAPVLYPRHPFSTEWTSRWIRKIFMLSRLKRHGDAIHAVAFAGWFGAIVEYMA